MNILTVTFFPSLLLAAAGLVQAQELPAAATRAAWLLAVRARPALDSAAMPDPVPPRLGRELRATALLALPLSGWYAASRLGVPVSFFGLQLPAIAERVQGAPGLIADLHENAGTIILYLAGLHAVMAVWHQFVLRDGTLQRMSLH